MYINVSFLGSYYIHSRNAAFRGPPVRSVGAKQVMKAALNVAFSGGVENNTPLFLNDKLSESCSSEDKSQCMHASNPSKSSFPMSNNKFSIPQKFNVQLLNEPCKHHLWAHMHRKKSSMAKPLETLISSIN